MRQRHTYIYSEQIKNLHIMNICAYKNREIKKLRSALTRKNSNLAARVKNAFAATGDGIWERDLISEQVWFSERMSELLYDQRKENIIDWETAQTFVYPADRSILYSAFDRLIAGDQSSLPVTIRLQKKNGTILHVLVRGRVITNSDKQPLSLIGSVTNITDLIEERERTKALSNLAEKNPGPILQYNASGEFLYANSSAHQLLQDIGKTPEQLYKDLPIENCMFKDDGIAELEFTIKDRHFLCTMALWKQDGQPVMCLYILDVTERHKHQIEMEQAKKRAEAANIAKSDFLSTMSHELRTPLNGIIGLSEVLSQKIHADADSRKLIETISVSSNSLLSLINDILDFSKIEAGDFSLVNQTFNLVNLLDELFDIFGFMAQEKGLKFITKIEPNICQYIYNDDLRLRQILNNLIGNALKFTVSGYICIKAQTIQRDKKSFISISVEDSGIGIKQENLDKIFNKFESIEGRSFGGTGLGLAISKQIISMMGGEIQVDSVYGQGTCFSVYFPANLDLVDQSLSEHNTILKNEILNTKTSLKILIVDDHPVNLLTLKLILESLGNYTVIEATSGADAVEIYQGYANELDMIIMDYHMPHKNGLEAGRDIIKIQKENKWKKVPIIIATADAMKETQQLCFDLGMDDYITKPITKEAVFNKIAHHIAAIAETSTTIQNAPISDFLLSLDTTHLQSLIGDDPRTYEELYRLYLTQAQDIILKLKINHDDENAEKWRELAHKLKGASANLGAFKMAALCKYAEERHIASIDEKSNLFIEIVEELKIIGQEMLVKLMPPPEIKTIN